MKKMVKYTFILFHFILIFGAVTGGRENEWVEGYPKPWLVNFNFHAVEPGWLKHQSVFEAAIRISNS